MVAVPDEALIAKIDMLVLPSGVAVPVDYKYGKIDEPMIRRYAQEHDHGLFGRRSTRQWHAFRGGGDAVAAGGCRSEDQRASTVSGLTEIPATNWRSRFLGNCSGHDGRFW